MTTDNIIVLHWFNHYGDKYLMEDYDDLQKEFTKHEQIKCLFDNDRAGVFSYPDSAHEALWEYKDSLFNPEYYSSLDEMATMYGDDPDPAALFGQFEYDLELIAIGKMAGDDEREFDRLWTERFVFGDEACLCY